MAYGSSYLQAEEQEQGLRAPGEEGLRSKKKRTRGEAKEVRGASGRGCA